VDESPPCTREPVLLAPSSLGTNAMSVTSTFSVARAGLGKAYRGPAEEVRLCLLWGWPYGRLFPEVGVSDLVGAEGGAGQGLQGAVSRLALPGLAIWD
jgi:hypothetical protein